MCNETDNDKRKRETKMKIVEIAFCVIVKDFFLLKNNKRILEKFDSAMLCLCGLIIKLDASN